MANQSNICCIESTQKFSTFSTHQSKHKESKYIKLSVICPYTNRFVIKAITKRKQAFELTNDKEKAEFQWGDYETLHWESILSGRMKGSSYCTRKGMSRKAQLSKYLNKHTTKNPTSILKSSAPKTVIVDTWEAFDESFTINFGGEVASFGDDVSLRKSFSLSDRIDWALEHFESLFDQNLEKKYILKASTLNKGSCVFLIENFQHFRKTIHLNVDIREWVLQEYIGKPLLIKGCKFHVRLYALAVGCVSVYVLRKALLLSSSIPYEEGNFSDPKAHITNTSFQETNGNKMNALNVHLFGDLVHFLVEERKFTFEMAVSKVEALFSTMCDIVKELFSAFKGEFSVFSPLRNCFEQFGIDFLIDQSFHVWLLEVNPGPDFKQTGKELSGVVDDFIEDTAKVFLDGDFVKDRNKLGKNIGGLIEVYNESWMGESDGLPSMKMF